MRELPDISQLQVFVAVAEAGSFGGGAGRVGLTRSAAGKAIARLEDQLAVRLFHRTTRSVGLTPDGRAFLERATQIIRDLEEVRDTLSQEHARPRGILRLTTTEAFGRQVVLPILGEFLARWPDLRAETSLTDRIADLVEEGFDLAIRFGPPPKASDLICRVIARSSAQLCASPDYLAKRGIPDRPEDLASHRLLMFDNQLRPRGWDLASGGGPAVAAPGRPTLIADNAGALLDAAVEGLGITCPPRFLIRRSVDAGRLTVLLPGYAPPETPIWAIYPTRRHLAPKVRLFIELLSSRLAAEGWPPEPGHPT